MIKPLLNAFDVEEENREMNNSDEGRI